MSLRWFDEAVSGNGDKSWRSELTSAPCGDMDGKSKYAGRIKSIFSPSCLLPLLATYNWEPIGKGEMGLAGFWSPHHRAESERVCLGLKDNSRQSSICSLPKQCRCLEWRVAVVPRGLRWLSEGGLTEEMGLRLDSKRCLESMRDPQE